MKYKKLLLSIVIVFGISLLGTSVYYSYVDGRTDMPTFDIVPPMPDDFDAIIRDIIYVDLCSLDENYWKQPEFYGDAWEISKTKFYDNPNYARWGIHGQGNLPSDIGYGVTNMKKGNELEICSFFHNGFGIWTWQGFGLTSVYNGNEDLFDIQITPNQILTEPTFPVFNNNWVQKIHVKITAKQDIPPGDYRLGFDVTAPTLEFSRDKRKQILYGEYKNKVLYKEECVRRLHDVERCDNLINLREKKYVDGGGYKTSESLMRISLIAEGNDHLAPIQNIPIPVEQNNES